MASSSFWPCWRPTARPTEANADSVAIDLSEQPSTNVSILERRSGMDSASGATELLKELAMQLAAEAAAVTGCSQTDAELMDVATVDDIHLQLQQQLAELIAAAAGSSEGSGRGDAASTCQQQQALLPWPQRYQPVRAGAVCGNAGSVQLLHSWLTNWQGRMANESQQQQQGGNGASSPVRGRGKSAASVGGRGRRQRRSSEFVDGSDDWSGGSDGWLVGSDSDDEGRGRYQAPPRGGENAIVLSGPPGCGKTAAAYACAQELGLEVLEVNPSSERTGAQILRLVGEATQSRRLTDLAQQAQATKVATKPQAAAAQRSLFSAPGAKVAAVTKDAAKPSARGKRKTISDDSTSPSPVRNRRASKRSQPPAPPPPPALDLPPPPQSAASRNTLVLFEGADLLLEEDRGFLSVLCDLIQESKRPVILLINATELPPQLSGQGIQLLNFQPPSRAELLHTLVLTCAAELQLLHQRQQQRPDIDTTTIIIDGAGDSAAAGIAPGSTFTPAVSTGASGGTAEVGPRRLPRLQELSDIIDACGRDLRACLCAAQFWASAAASSGTSSSSCADGAGKAAAANPAADVELGQQHGRDLASTAGPLQLLCADSAVSCLFEGPQARGCGSSFHAGSALSHGQLQRRLAAAESCVANCLLSSSYCGLEDGGAGARFQGAAEEGRAANPSAGGAEAGPGAVGSCGGSEALAALRTPPGAPASTVLPPWPQHPALDTPSTEGSLGEQQPRASAQWPFASGTAMLDGGQLQCWDLGQCLGVAGQVPTAMVGPSLQLSSSDGKAEPIQDVALQGTTTDTAEGVAATQAGPETLAVAPMGAAAFPLPAVEARLDKALEVMPFNPLLRQLQLADYHEACTAAATAHLTLVCAQQAAWRQATAKVARKSALGKRVQRSARASRVHEDAEGAEPGSEMGSAEVGEEEDGAGLEAGGIEAGVAVVQGTEGGAEDTPEASMAVGATEGVGADAGPRQGDHCGAGPGSETDMDSGALAEGGARSAGLGPQKGGTGGVVAAPEQLPHLASLAPAAGALPQVASIATVPAGLAVTAAEATAPAQEALQGTAPTLGALPEILQAPVQSAAPCCMGLQPSELPLSSAMEGVIGGPVIDGPAASPVAAPAELTVTAGQPTAAAKDAAMVLQGAAAAVGLLPHLRVSVQPAAATLRTCTVPAPQTLLSPTAMEGVIDSPVEGSTQPRGFAPEVPGAEPGMGAATGQLQPRTSLLQSLLGGVSDSCAPLQAPVLPSQPPQPSPPPALRYPTAATAPGCAWPRPVPLDAHPELRTLLLIADLHEALSQAAVLTTPRDAAPLGIRCPRPGCHTSQLLHTPLLPGCNMALAWLGSARRARYVGDAVRDVDGASVQACCADLVQEELRCGARRPLASTSIWAAGGAPPCGGFSVAQQASAQILATLQHAALPSGAGGSAASPALDAAGDLGSDGDPTTSRDVAGSSCDALAMPGMLSQEGTPALWDYHAWCVPQANSALLHMSRRTAGEGQASAVDRLAAVSRICRLEAARQLEGARLVGRVRRVPRFRHYLQEQCPLDEVLLPMLLQLGSFGGGPAGCC